MFVTPNSPTHLGAVKGKRCLFLQISRESAKVSKAWGGRNRSDFSHDCLKVTNEDSGLGPDPSFQKFLSPLPRPF